MNISMNPNGELYQSAVNAPGAIDIPESFLNEARQFRELNMRYACAIREVKTKLEVLNDDLAVRNQRNPIQMIKSRVKKPESIIEKLHRRGFPISVESVRENLYDVAGIRVICSFVDDIYTVAEMLARQDDINVLMVKDYIRCPKVNGYRSYHMIIEVPVFFSDRRENMRVEVQIRTIAMDFWASPSAVSMRGRQSSPRRLPTSSLTSPTTSYRRSVSDTSSKYRSLLLSTTR